LVFLCVSCVTSHDYYVDKSCDDFTENPLTLQDSFNIEIGDKIYIKLCSNATTGFQWSYEMGGDTVLKEEDYDFEEPESDALGAAGKETWTFEAIESGTTIIFMEYSQPWEDGIKGEWLYKIIVVVE
jgi:inhibitor of cysteine peptidase